MTVVDASVVVDALAVNSARAVAARALLDEAPVIDAPAILKAEALSAMRRFEARNDLSGSNALAAVDQLTRLRIQPHPVEPFMARIWELRSNLSVYDAWCVALAEELNTTLVTTDHRLAAAPGPRCPIEVVE